jgi:hypothetical protein
MADEVPSLSLRSLEAWLAEMNQHEREGELFQAYDVAMRGLIEHPDALELKHRAVLCLASTGATRQAVTKFATFALDGAAATAPNRKLRMDIATLKARLAKDAALARNGEERLSRLREAARLYEAAFVEAAAASNREAYYPGINAASLFLLAGSNKEATALARTVLEQLGSLPPEQRGYFECISEIEALLVLGRLDELRLRVKAARRLLAAPGAIGLRDLASTIRQLRLVVAANRLEDAWFAELAPPRVVHYLGHVISAPGGGGRFPAAQEGEIAAAIEARIAEAGIGFDYGSLAAGADILFAEALLRHGASLHVVLPFNRAEFVEISVRLAGNRWAERFEECLAAAESNGTVDDATEDRYLGDDALFGYCSQLAMGLAILRADHLCTEAEQIAVWDGNPASGPRRHRRRYGELASHRPAAIVDPLRRGCRAGCCSDRFRAADQPPHANDVVRRHPRLQQAQRR